MNPSIPAVIIHGYHKGRVVYIVGWNQRRQQFQITDDPLFVKPQDIALSRHTMANIIENWPYEDVFKTYEINQVTQSLEYIIKPFVVSFKIKSCKKRRNVSRKVVEEAFPVKRRYFARQSARGICNKDTLENQEKNGKLEEESTVE